MWRCVSKKNDSNRLKEFKVTKKNKQTKFCIIKVRAISLSLYFMHNYIYNEYNTDCEHMICFF